MFMLKSIIIGKLKTIMNDALKLTNFGMTETDLCCAYLGRKK